MRTPWQRLRADRPHSSTAVELIVVLVLVVLSWAHVSMAHHGRGAWNVALGGVLLPALSVLLVLPDPARYRDMGQTMGQWKFDHGILVALVAVAHLAWPVWDVVDRGHPTGTAPVWTPLPPTVGITCAVALVLYRHRHILAGRVSGTGHRFAGTPLHYRVFLARRGPLLWRVVYQPVGMTASLTVLALAGWMSVGDDESQSLISGFLLAALVIAPVVAASRTTASAVGLSRRSWFRHTMAAVAVPQGVAGVTSLVHALVVSGGLTLDSYFGGATSPGPTLVAIAFAVTVVSAVLAAAFAVSVSYEDWGTAIMWLIGFGMLTTFIVILGFTSSDGPWPSVAALVATAVLARFLVAYAYRKTLVGQPEWTLTTIIGGRYAS